MNLRVIMGKVIEAIMITSRIISALREGCGIPLHMVWRMIVAAA